MRSSTGMGDCDTTIVYGEVVAEPATFVATIEKVYEPATVGLPEIAPVVGFNVSPAGKLPVVEYVGAGYAVALTESVYGVEIGAVGPNAVSVKYGIWRTMIV